MSKLSSYVLHSRTIMPTGPWISRYPSVTYGLTMDPVTLFDCTPETRGCQNAVA